MLDEMGPMIPFFLAVSGVIIFTAATIELWADAKARAWDRVATGHAERRAAYIRRKYLGIYKAMTGQKDPVGWAIPCTALSPDSRLNCDLEAGHPSWHSCDGSLWFGDNWDVDQFADTQRRAAATAQDDTINAADWPSPNQPARGNRRMTLTDRIFVAAWRNPMMGGCEISEHQRHRTEWLEDAA